MKMPCRGRAAASTGPGSARVNSASASVHADMPATIVPFCPSRTSSTGSSQLRREAQALKRDDIRATDHVDHTGRLQTVSRAVAPRYYKLIEYFAELTGIPVLLNTSFNENEPIVCSPDDAIECFLRTHMDALAIGGFLVRKADAAP